MTILQLPSILLSLVHPILLQQGLIYGIVELRELIHAGSMNPFQKHMFYRSEEFVPLEKSELAL